MKEKNYSQPENDSEFDFSDEEQKLVQNISGNDKNFSNSSNKFLIDEIQSNSTFTKYPIFSFLCTFFILMTTCMNISSFSLIIVPFKEKFNLSNGLIMVTSSAYYLGNVIGSFISSFCAQKFGRILSINLSNILIVVFHLLMSLIFNVPVFIISRLIIGFFLGISLPISFNICGEYQSIKNRGVILMTVFPIGIIASITQNSIALLVFPQLELNKLKLFLLILLIFPVSSMIICFIFLRDSPRHLILLDGENNSNQAFEILKSMNKGKDLSPEQKDQLMKEIKELSENRKYRGKYTDIFKNKYLKTTLFLIVIVFCIGCNSYGLFMVTELTMNQLTKKDNEKAGKEKHKRKELIINQLLITSANFIAGVIGSFLIKTKIKRKTFIIIFFTLTAITVLLSPFKLTLYKIFSPISLGLNNITYNFVIIYVIEVYPTIIRDISTSFHLFINMISAFISQYLYIGINKINYRIPFYLSFCFSIISAIITGFLPYETLEKPLDI